MTATTIKRQHQGYIHNDGPTKRLKTASNSFATTLTLNHDALLLMHGQDECEAATKVLRKAILNMENGSGTDNDISIEVSGALVSVAKASDCCRDASFLPYTNGITLVKSTTKTASTVRKKEDVNRVLEIALRYNYALSMHLGGLKKGSDSLLNQALEAYKTCGHLLAKMQRNPFTQILQLAILNNCGQIHHYSHRVHQVHTCLKDMRSCICQITKGWTRAVPSQITSFSSNILMNAENYARPAPAA